MGLRHSPHFRALTVEPLVGVRVTAMLAGAARNWLEDKGWLCRKAGAGEGAELPYPQPHPQRPDPAPDTKQAAAAAFTPVSRS